MLLLIPSAVTACLGTWQLQRGEWKKGELQARSAALEAPAISTKELAGRDGAEEYTRVKCEGTLETSKTQRIGPRVRSVCGVTQPGRVELRWRMPS